MLRIIFNGTIIISHDICWNISSIICSRKRQSVIGMLTSIKLNSTYSGYVKHLMKRMPNLELGKHIIGSSVFFYVNVDVFFLCKFCHLWFRICWSETRVAPSLWTVALKLFRLMPWVWALRLSVSSYVSPGLAVLVAIMIAIKAITRGPGPTGLQV